MEARTFRVMAKTFKVKNNIQLRVGDGGMMTGGASEVIDLDTGTTSCDLKEGQVIQGIINGLIVDNLCRTCILRYNCQATAYKSSLY